MSTRFVPATPAVRVAAILTLAMLAAQVSAGTPDRETVLERVRAAVGYPAQSVSGVRLNGRAIFLQNEVDYRLEIAAPGVYRQSFDGPFPVVDGFDGETAWMVDIGGEVRHLSFGEHEEARLAGQILTHAWLGPAGRLELAEVIEWRDDHAVLAFSHADGKASGEVVIDAETWHPRRWNLRGLGAEERILRFEGHVATSGPWFPAEITTSEADTQQTRISLAGVEAWTGAISAPAVGVPGDTRFDPGTDAALEVVRGPHGHLLVHPRIHGRDLGWFIFDSGAGITALDARAVRALELESLGSVPAHGVGGRVDAPLHRIESLSLGPMTVTDLGIAEFDFEFLDQYMGRPVAGVIGLSVFSRSVVELSQRNADIALHDPAAFDSSGYDWLPMQLDNRLPVVTARFESHEGLFAIDTGDGGNVTFYLPTVESHNLLEGRRTRARQQGGVGGEVTVRRGRVQSFELGSHRFERLRADFMQDVGGTHSHWVAGRLGVGVLEPFTILFDYSGSRLALVPDPE